MHPPPSGTLDYWFCCMLALILADVDPRPWVVWPTSVTSLPHLVAFTCLIFCCLFLCCRSSSELAKGRGVRRGINSWHIFSCIPTQSTFWCSIPLQQHYSNASFSTYPYTYYIHQFSHEDYTLQVTCLVAAPLWMWELDVDGWSGKTNLGLWKQMLQKDAWHITQRA